MGFTKRFFNIYAIEAWDRSKEEKVWIVPGPYNPAGYANEPRIFDDNGNPTDFYHRTPNATFEFLKDKGQPERYRRIGIYAWRDWDRGDKGEVLFDYGADYVHVAGISIGADIKKKLKNTPPSPSSSDTEDSSTSSYEPEDSSTSYVLEGSSTSTYSSTIVTRSKTKNTSKSTATSESKISSKFKTSYKSGTTSKV